MAGEIESGWVRIAIEAGAMLAGGGGLVAYVKTKLKQHSQQIQELREGQEVMRGEMARGVRPQDFKMLYEEIKELRADNKKIYSHLLEQAKK
jgi:hypothetical protein